jgi:hypothetical protein
MRLVPKNQRSIVDIGARDGFMANALTVHFERVIALDLTEPSFSIERVARVAGDVTQLPFDGESMDCVLCTEVLEHISSDQLSLACSEIRRVTRVAAVIGVPFRQDLRAGRTLCGSCGHVNPPWGHVNSFDEDRLLALFRPMRPASIEFVWPTKEDRTNWVSAALMSMAGFPWGTYAQEEPCIQCGSRLIPRTRTSVVSRACARASVVLDAAQRAVITPRPWWLHIRFEKP